MIEHHVSIVKVQAMGVSSKGSPDDEKAGKRRIKVKSEELLQKSYQGAENRKKAIRRMMNQAGI